MRRRVSILAGRVRFALVACGLSTLALAHAHTNDVDFEAPVEAEYVERFTHFIEWPSEAFATPEAPFVLCVLGRTPVAYYLDSFAHEHLIKGRPVELRHLGPTAELSPCHLVFIASDERAYLKQILGHTAGRPIVTVSDSEGFGRAGVLINLLLDNQGRVRFEISTSTARASMLTLDAQLLKLSRAADRGP